MTETQIIDKGQSVYLLFLRPDLSNDENRCTIVDFLRCSPNVSNSVIEKLINSEGWRSRLLGFALAVRKKPEDFVTAIIASLQNPAGLAIVPGCAAMVVGFENSKSKELPAETKKLDRKIFDGDMGWALDKAAFHLGISKSDPSGASPYYGLSFEQHLNTFRWIRDRFPTDEKRSEA